MISIIKTPSTYSPVGNPLIFQIQSNNPDIVYFLVQVVETNSGGTIINQKYYIRPDYINGISFNLSDVLSNLVETQISNYRESIAVALTGATLSYRLIITEKIIQSGQVVSGAVYNNAADKFTVWDAELSRLLFSNYNQNRYVANTSLPAKFLSLKDQISKQSGTSTEHLYFLNRNNIAKQCRIRTYDISGNQNHLYLSPVPSGDMVRFNVSPKTINHIHNTDFGTVGHYRIDLLDANGAVVSEEKIYKYSGYKCILQPINILFSNSLGAFESFTFFNPIESVTTSKTSLATNILQMDNGIYNDNTDGILNETNKVIDVKSTSTFKAFSDVLSDNETIMLKELITSKRVYLELSDNKTLVPITITNNNYNVALRRTNGFKLNRLEINFTVQSGFVPSKSNLFGSGEDSAMIQFQDLPLPPEGGSTGIASMVNRNIPITSNSQKVFIVNDVPSGDTFLAINGNIVLKSSNINFTDGGDYFGEVINNSYKITLNVDVFVDDNLTLIYLKTN